MNIVQRRLYTFYCRRLAASGTTLLPDTLLSTQSCPKAKPDKTIIVLQNDLSVIETENFKRDIGTLLRSLSCTLTRRGGMETSKFTKHIDVENTWFQQDGAT
ncbi:hypothetical protein QTP88_002574 [Uroleucon formosanum]